MANRLARCGQITDGSWNHTDIVDYWSTDERVGSNDPTLTLNLSVHILKNHNNNESTEEIKVR